MPGFVRVPSGSRPFSAHGRVSPLPAKHTGSRSSDRRRWPGRGRNPLSLYPFFAREAACWYAYRGKLGTFACCPQGYE